MIRLRNSSKVAQLYKRSMSSFVLRRKERGWNKKDTSNDEACQSVLAQILKAKKPRVVLCCHTSYSYENEVLKCLEVKVKNYGLRRKKVVFAEGHETDLLQSFHPACAVENTECRPEFRALLIHHFVAAFSVLSDKFTFPDSVEEIRKLCLRTGNRLKELIPKLEDAEAANFISVALQGKYEDAQIEPKYPGFAYDTEGEMEVFDKMYARFQRLIGSGTNTFGTLGIAITITFYWKKHFKKDPMKEQLRHWLLIRGSEQEDWFPSPGHCETHNTHDPLKVDEITSLEYSLSKMSFAPPSDSTLQEMRSINDEITHLASAFLALIRLELVASTMPDNLKNLVYRQKCLIEGYIKQSPVANISNTLRIWRLMQRCEFLADMVANSIADSKECERVLEDLLASVKQLTPILQSLSV
ncbi:uncharacterized protein BHQ10_000148 [Talaromyces amestolkiae]|uniref:Uncharacterized protein n=1 Tax=Talaromyces amestolkiae TaxID=1196081 RepID=A0A364KKR1_TALAM|nr:uncharacterized protein BHQ10_000148 [Talaromyces amestolkiae]RAO64136.1 hypothetical protein BHQ10_000148 [Talaromyces amestolkiae]